MTNENTKKENNNLFIKVTMAVLAVAVIILTVINSVPAFSRAENAKESGVTTAETVNTDANSANVTYYELLNETVEG